MSDHLRDLLKPVHVPGLLSPSPLSLPKTPDGSPPHPGLVIQAVRQARGVTLEELATATGYRRRDKTLKRLQRLESDGAPPSSGPGPHRLGSGWTKLLEAVLTALDLSPDWLTDLSDRLAVAAALQHPPDRAPVIHAQGDTWRRLAHAPLPSGYQDPERGLLGEALGFLMENRALVARDPSLYFLRPAEALLTLNPPPPHPWSALDPIPAPPSPHLLRPLHLGLLLDLWSRGLLVLDGSEDDPLLVLRCTGHDRLGTAVVSGIHRRSRRWGHRTLTDGLDTLLPPEVRLQVEERTRDQTDLLWERHRLRLAYELRRDRHQEDQTLDSPPWMSSWLNESVREDVGRQWEHMNSALKESCLVPLTDPRWDEGFPRLEWIQGCDTDRWRRWHTGRPHGWSDAMLRQRAQQTFAQRLIDDIPDQLVCPTLPEAISRMRS